MAETSVLLEMPREIRNNIYRFSGVEHVLTTLQADESSASLGPSALKIWPSLNLNLLCVCHKIYDEYKEQWSAHLQMHISLGDELDLSLSRIPLSRQVPADVFLQVKVCMVTMNTAAVSNSVNRKMIVWAQGHDAEGLSAASDGGYRRSNVTRYFVVHMLRQLSAWISSNTKIRLHLGGRRMFGTEDFAQPWFRNTFDPTNLTAAALSNAVPIDSKRLSILFYEIGTMRYVIDQNSLVQAATDADKPTSADAGHKGAVVGVKKANGTAYIARASKVHARWVFKPLGYDERGGANYYGFMPIFVKVISLDERKGMLKEGAELGLEEVDDTETDDAEASHVGEEDVERGETEVGTAEANNEEVEVADEEVAV